MWVPALRSSAPRRAARCIASGKRTVIPGRLRREPGIHNHERGLWIPGPRQGACPGMTGREGKTMITLYHCHAARSFRPLWMLEELALPYELKMLPFPPRVFAKEYLALNPLGTIPFMVDGETRMTESSGICHYLGVRHGPTPLTVRPEDPAYGAFLNWMYFSDATLTFPQTLVLRYSQLEPEERRNPQVAGDYAKWFLGRLRA